jgi:hypothetical protein
MDLRTSRATKQFVHGNPGHVSILQRFDHQCGECWFYSRTRSVIMCFVSIDKLMRSTSNFIQLVMLDVD